MLCRKFDFALFGFLFLVSMVVVLLCPSAWAASEDQFRVRTTSDDVALCTAQPDQPNYVAAIHFCQGLDGDQQMLGGTAAGSGPRFEGLVHHTDAVREKH